MPCVLAHACGCQTHTPRTPTARRAHAGTTSTADTNEALGCAGRVSAGSDTKGCIVQLAGWGWRQQCQCCVLSWAAHSWRQSPTPLPTPLPTRPAGVAWHMLHSWAMLTDDAAMDMRGLSRQSSTVRDATGMLGSLIATLHDVSPTHVEHNA